MLHILQSHLLDSCKRPPEILSSPPFYVNSLQNTGWSVILVISKKSEHITCSLSRIIKDSGPKNIDVDLEIAFLAADNSPMVRKTRRYLFDHNEACVFESFAKKTDVLVGRKCDILHNECLRVRCRMWKAADMLPRSVLCFAHTDLGTESEVFYWAIDRFSLLKRGGRSFV
ncbi:speckle-type POZ protein [Caerostris extrusa]|uniref:Speckle-type POZ protein n=1 Tax=Caerostris extrusa TaxID=172846 RepID=A0AAV4WY43_CAEEX|nr:speckle-type POZ protein [Caerostris extrusa]